MKLVLLILLVAMSVASTFGQDSVDKVSHHYEILASEGLEKLHQRQVAELEEVKEVKEVKERALADKNLELANKANAPRPSIPYSESPSL